MSDIQTTQSVSQALTDQAIIELLGTDKLKELAKLVKAPPKPQSQATINRRGYNNSVKGKLMSFDLVYKTIRKDDFNLSSRCSQKSIADNKNRIMSKLKGLASDAGKGKLSAMDRNNVARLEKVLTNKNFFVDRFFTKSQQAKVKSDKSFTATQIIDRIIVALTVSAKHFDDCVNKHNEDTRIAKLRSKYMQ